MKIASLQPSISVILDRLGCLDALVACTKYCLDVVPALRDRNISIIHDSWSTHVEELLALHPDLVIASVPYRQESLTAILKAGYPVLTLAPHSLADIYQDIRLIASIVHATSRGEQVIADMQSAIADVQTRVASLSARPLVYCEEWGKPLIHSQFWVKELIEIAGGIFLGEPGATTSVGAIAAANPDMLIMAWCGAGNRVPLERVIEQREWQHLRAIQYGRVYCIADELLNTPAPTLMDGLSVLAHVIHPDIFDSAVKSAYLRCIDQSSKASNESTVKIAPKVAVAGNTTQNESGVEIKALRFVVAALILRADEILICQRRPDQPMALKWEFPGGKIEPGETPEEALLRELDEELGIHATIGPRVAHTRHTYRNGGSIDLQFFVVNTFEGEVTNHIFNDVRWVPIRDLASYDFLAADRDLIRDLAAGKLL